MPDKSRALSKLEEAKKQNLFDSGMEEIVSLINSFDEYYTTSSCAGRIVASESTDDNEKKSHRWLGKWHRKVSKEEVLGALKKRRDGVLWLSVEPMILHVACRDIDSASNLLKGARECGLKRGGIYQLKPRIIAEIAGVDGFCAPLGAGGEIFADERRIEFLVGLANKKISCNSLKRKRFMEKISVPL